MELNRTNNKLVRKHNNWSHGDGLAFDGVVNYVEFPNINYPTSAFSEISFIAIIDDLLGLTNTIYQNYFATSGRGVRLDYSKIGNDLYVQYYATIIGNTAQSYKSFLVVNHDFTKPTHIAITKNNTNDVSGIKCFVNGTEIITVDFSINNLPIASFTTSNGFIGIPQVSQYFNGIVYDLKIFNKTLTLAEVKYMYDRKGQTLPSTAAANLVAWYDFSQRQGTILLDKSPNALHGTLQNYTLANTSFGVANQWKNQYNLAHLNP